MDDRRFDDLVRSLSIRLPRRGLGPLAGGLLAALGLDDDADAGRREKRRRDDDDDRDRDGPARRPDPAGPEPAKKKKKKKKKKPPQPPPPSCGSAGASCTSSLGCCGALYCFGGRCAYSGTNPCPDDQYECGGACTWSACCPTGQKLCNGACVAQSACCPACGAGQTCVNGSCTGGSGGCPAGSVACEGLCLADGSCCPLCGADQTCSNGRCESIGIDRVELESCLATTTDNASLSAATCQVACADPASTGCETCLLEWLASDRLGLFDCYGSVYDGPGTADDVSAAQNFGLCRQMELKTCYRRAFDELPGNIRKQLVDGAKDYVEDCLKTLPPKCDPIVTTLLKSLASAGGAASLDFFDSIRTCWGYYGCRNGLFIPGVTAHKLCMSNNQCCLNGQKWDGDTCCWDGSQCPVVSGFMTYCCQRDTNDRRKVCALGRCLACGIDLDGRATGDTCCVPDCDGKCGGDDGCEGTCPDTCAAPQVCNTTTNTCCTPDCAGKCGGPNGCGGTCANTCTAPQVCNPAIDTCCTPNCASKCGGADGCGGVCPDTCPTGQVCNGTTCVPGNGGACPNNCVNLGWTCTNGVCTCPESKFICGELCVDRIDWYGNELMCCGDFTCYADGECCGGGCCAPGTNCCGGNACCDSGSTCCGTRCCPTWGHHCCGDRCCANTLRCCADGCCDPL